MKRKVFSLMMLCLFAFLGIASAQQGDMNVTPNPIDLGYRPIGSWMAPLQVQFTGTTITSQTITSIEAENEFFVIDANLPGTVNSANPFNFTVTHGEATPGAINSKLVAMTSNRKAYLFDISAVAYEPVGADVFEIAPEITFPFSATVGENVYDNYLLPGNAADGKDVVYKMTIEDDVLFTANVEGENGKIAVYTEDFNGEPGPGADNNYEGISTGGNAITPYEAMIGDQNSTSTTGYFPFYTLYNYSIAEQLYLATELIEAGMNTVPMASLSFESTNEPGKEEKNISIWMANVTDEELTTTSHSTANMTLVYTGNITPVAGWNEFVFNQSQFAWDGSSNLLICVERADGGWLSPSIKWKSHNAGFKGLAYAYRDASAYGMDSNTYTMYNSTSRANTLFKSVSGRVLNNRDNMLSDMTLTPGVYYLAASSTSEEFTVNADIDILPVPEQATNPSPADGQTGISMPAILSWEFGNYTTAYRVLLGTTYPPTNVVVDWTNELSSTLAVTNLSNNKNYFWRVDERNTNGMTEGQVWGFTTALNIPQNLTSVNEKIYQGDALELTWDNINDRSYRGYNVYKDGEQINTSLITTTEYTVNGLTYNMDEGYVFNVTAVYDEGESEFSNDLIAFVTGEGAISGKVCELDGVTGIAGVEIHIEGTDEFQRPAEYIFTSGSNGIFNNNVLAGNYTAWVMKDGYQPASYDGNILVNFGQVTQNVNFIMQENLLPVGEVIAEQMSANQVKVYWSSNVMSEIVEDFETGDFSAFPWQNDATYPWSVVTTNAYEGSYCMKSGNEGVNSSTSAIEVSVEISRDGLMSFFQKISSESSYDKGYFYIDGTEKVNVSGAGSWQQKEYPITAGVHSFKWAYTKDSSVSSNDDCWYVDNISFVHDAAPVPEGTVYDFENGLDPWISIDADGDGYGWEYGPDVLSGGYGHNSTEGFALSRSYVNYVGALTPDNYLVSPMVALGGSVTLYACGQDASYAAEHFGVGVSTTGMNPSDFTMLQEWTLTAKGERYSGTRGTREQGTWYQFTVDLSAYSGNGYVAIRHFNCTDMFYLDLDDVIISSEPAKSRAFNHYNVYRATEGNESEAELLTSVTDTVFFDNEMANLEPGIYKWGVSTVYEGNRGSRDVLASADFEDGTLGNWTSLDADGDGNEWYVLNTSTIPGHNGSVGLATSASYLSGVLYPDNYLISPQVALGGTIHFYACAQDASWAAEHFGVAVSTTNTSASAFTMVQEWTMSAKSAGATTSDTRSGNRDQGTWYEYTVDLSNYSGNGYVAIRHFNCSDMFRLNVDDIEITGAGEPGPVDPPTPPIVGGNESEIVWSNPIENKMYVTTEITVLNNAAESPEGAVVVMTNISEPEMNLVYSATLDETGYYMWDNMRRGSYNITINQEGFEPVDEVVEIGDENFLRYVLIEIIEPLNELYVSGTGWAMFGNIPTPVDPDDPPTPPTEGQWYYYDNGEYATGIGTGGGQFKWGVMFPAGSYAGNQLTKVKVYDGDYPMTGDVTIYSGGSSEPGTAVGTMNVTFTGIGDFIELEFPNPVVIDPSQNLWVVFYNASGATYPAAASDDVTNDPNGRWVYLEGYGWMDCADAGVAGYSWMIRAYVGGGAKGEVEEITLNQQPCTAGTLAKVDNPNHRSVEYYIVKLNGELEGNTTLPFFQHNVENLVEGETYTTTVQKMYSTGLSDPISFDWVYTPCDNFEGLQSADAQWAGEDVVLTWVLPEGGDGPTPPPTPPTNVYDFEDGTMQGWTSLDADGDGFGWNMMSSFGTGYGHNGSIDGVFSQSYDNNYGVLYPDNYLVSPQVTLGGEIKFWACGQDASYVAEHFGVAVSTTTATAGAFTTLQEWTMTGKGNGAPTDVTRSGNRAQGSWHQYTVDLSNYAGQTGYVAIRHFNCSDMFYLDVDDIELGGGGGDDPNPPTPPVGDVYDFEDGTMQGWSSLDADGDGFGWNMMSNFGSGYGHNGSLDGVFSQSYDNNYGVLYPDNYLVSPQVTFDGSITFWACGQDASYVAEHFGVAVSTTTATAGAFTTIQEWTMTGKGNGAPTDVTRSGNRAQGSWHQYTVDLSAYAGQTGYVAIRHFNCSDMFYLDVDDIELGGGGGDDPNPPTPPVGDVYDFEDGTMQGWSSLDADGDGFGWNMMSNFGTGYGHNGSLDGVFSQSYDNNYGVLYPDNYLVSPQITLGGQISFWACGQDASYVAEHFGVAVSTTTATAGAFTTIQEWTMTGKGVGAPTNVTRSGNRAQGSWHQYTVDLSAYSGQGYVAIRHFNCSDMFYLDVDDISLGDNKATRDLTYDFEDGTMQGWSSLDADGDGFGWNMMSNFGTGYGHNSSLDGVFSQSYDNNYGVLYPDNYLVSPQITFDGNITFWACGQDASYVAEHFGVAVSTTTATAGAFTTIQEWTMTGKGVGAPTNTTRSGNRAQGSWHQYTVDLSAYAGQTGYVAIRHFNCSDMFYLDVDDIVLGGEGGDDPNPPVDPPTGDIYDFEDGTMQGWTSLDADGDGFGWNMMSSFGTGYGHNGSVDGVFSQSYDNNYGVLYPDNYLVSPQVTLGGEIKFWACGQDASYVAEHFGVAVSTTTATAGAFTTIQEWTMTGKGNGAPTDVTRSGNRAQGSWHQYTVDLSAYAGQTGYVAIRHFNCSDMFYLDVDDIELGGGSGDDPNPPTPGANVRGVEIFRNGEWIAEVPATTTTFTDIAPGDVESYEIRVVYNGNLEDYTHYTMSCPEVLVPVEVVCLAPENLTGSYEYSNENDFGASINWTYSGEVNTSENHYDNGTYGTSIGLGGGQFQWAVMFPAGTYVGNTVTMVQAYDDRAMTGTVAIYTGASTPQTMIASTNIEFTGAGDWATFSFDEPVVVDPSQNIWVVIDNVSGTDYPAAASAETVSDPNGRWVAVSGSWMDLASAGVPGYCWMIRCFTSDLFFFQLFRNGELIAEVPYNNNEAYTYYDQVAIGNYQYQVNAVSSDCESEFALTPDGSQDYVEINVTSVTENIETRIYPNPTTGIVNIEANGMSHLTVVNTLGQIVFDSNISGDQYQMNLGQFKAGVYMVRITTEEGVSVKRVTVAK